VSQSDATVAADHDSRPGDPEAAGERLALVARALTARVDALEPEDRPTGWADYHLGPRVTAAASSARPAPACAPTAPPVPVVPVVPLGHVLAAELRGYAHRHPDSLLPAAVDELHSLLMAALTRTGHAPTPAPAPTTGVCEIAEVAEEVGEEPAAPGNPHAPAQYTVLVLYTDLGDPQVHDPDCHFAARARELFGLRHETLTVADRAALAARVYAIQIAEGGGTAEARSRAFAYQPCTSL
jgi:hypothetical protein